MPSTAAAIDTEELDGMLTLDPSAQDLLFREARTVNSFAPDPVTDDQLRAVYELFKWGPSSGNSQPLRLLALRTEEAKARLLPHLAEVNRPKTASAPVALVVASDVDYHRHLQRLVPYLDNPAARHADEGFRRRNAAYNTALQTGYLILAIRATGLAAGPMAGFDAGAVDQEFFPDGRLHASLIVNVGRPGHQPWMKRLPRLDADEVVTFL